MTRLRHLCGLQKLARSLLIVLLGIGCSRAVTPLSPWRQGIATNYGGPADGLSPYSPSFGTQDGSCGYGLLSQTAWPFWSVAALSTSNSFFLAGPIDACGQCFQIQCVNSGGQFAGRCNTDNPVSIIVQITDSCPECTADHIDIQALTFNKLAPIANGRIDTQYRRVECVPPAPMVVFVDNNNGPGSWLRLFIEQAGGVASISLVQVRTSDSNSAWISLNNVFGSDWEIGASPSYPLDIAIVSETGQTVTAYKVISATGQLGDFPTSVQFAIVNPTDQALTNPTGGKSGTPDTQAPPSGTSQATPAPPSPQSCTQDCYDVQTPTFTCAQQVGWGQCQQSWMLAGDSSSPQGFCRQSCGRCTPCSTD